jgi:hypothetical protein
MDTYPGLSAYVQEFLNTHEGSIMDVVNKVTARAEYLDDYEPDIDMERVDIDEEL